MWLLLWVLLLGVCFGVTVAMGAVIDPISPPCIFSAISASLLHGSPAHIKVVAEWDLSRKAVLFGVIPDEPPEHHESIAQQQQERAKYVEASLDDCLKVYTKTEKVGGTNVT